MDVAAYGGGMRRRRSICVWIVTYRLSLHFQNSSLSLRLIFPVLVDAAAGVSSTSVRLCTITRPRLPGAERDAQAF
ncbi:hypothetical protein MSAN_02029200 [Mycena sanguinolenta]|uniref:Uncharacterized protein n=1 Tax=Mycena sanguinolenta TaxID=230812 RepID=A0A8H6XK64_9AGAR|nr:hypothetical protein MSAN_02029200 [Mycena sanguinolenta]